MRFKTFWNNTKGQFSALMGLAIGIATLTITLVVTFLILAQGQDQVIEIENLGSSANTTSVALNATKTLTDAVADIPGWVPLIVIAVIGAVLLGLVALFKR